MAHIVLVVCKDEHRDKRPTNALIAKAVEVCVENDIGYLMYAQFTYYKKNTSSLAEFKRRNGFEEVRFPRYYVMAHGIFLLIGLLGSAIRCAGVSFVQVY